MLEAAKLSRRQFLKSAAAAAAAPYAITSFSLAGSGRPAPSERIVMGAIGVGSMGSGDLGGFLGAGEVQVVAVCDVDARRREGARRTVEGRYARQRAAGTYRGCEAYGDFRRITERKDIDAVMIATPDHWHAIPVIAAARNGKDIHCQKPLSLTIAEGRAMSDAVRRYGRVFQTGSQQRSDGRFRFACELVRNGRVGKLQTMEVGLPTGPRCGPLPPQPVPQELDYDFWLGQAPEAPYHPRRVHYQFRWILDYSGGQVTDWGAHHCDIAQWGNGTMHTGPVEIEGTGEFPADGDYNSAVNYRFTCAYKDGVKMIVSNRFPNGVRFVGDAGWVFVSRGRIDAEPKSILRSQIGPDEVHLYQVRRGHKGNFLHCVRTREETVAPIENAHRSLTIAHLGNIAMLLERKVHWDPDRERFVDDPEADRMLTRAMRDPWHL
jgi:predicted dehydrogenase